jgi:hypothetical protein
MIIALEMEPETFGRIVQLARAKGAAGDENQIVVDYIKAQIDYVNAAKFDMTVEYCKCPFPGTDHVSGTCATCGLTVRIYNSGPDEFCKCPLPGLDLTANGVCVSCSLPMRHT